MKRSAFFGRRVARILIPVVVLSLFAGLGCRQREEASPSVPRMAFEVDTTRLGETVESAPYGIRFQPPVGWSPLPMGTLDSLNRQMTALPDTALLRPLYVFLDTTSGSVLSVGRLRLDTLLTFGQQMEQYGTTLARQFEGDSLRQAQFMKDDLYMAQFLAQPEGLVNFKLVFEAPTDGLLQFDYVVPQAAYPQEVRSVESSIGSIQSVP